MTLHHVGCLVQNMDEAAGYYRELHPHISTPILIEPQGVRVCFVDTGSGVAIELVEPVNETSLVYKLLRKGIVFYHLGYLVPSYEAAVQDLSDKNYKLIQEFRSAAFEGRRCAFFTSPLAHLIEIIETPSV